MSSSSSSSSSRPNEKQKHLPSGISIGDFEVKDIVGEGSYGQIYEVFRQKDNKRFAMKIEYFRSHNKALAKEIQILKEISQISLEFTEYVESGHTKTFLYLVIELLGPSLSRLCRNLPTRTLSRFTLLNLGVHMVRCLQSLHGMGYIHRDVKPGNFLIRPNKVHPICLIDFGLAKYYLTNNGDHVKARDHPGFTGTFAFASINAHEEKELSRRDDMMSWFYSMVELADGSLPWTNNNDRKDAPKMKKEANVAEMTRMIAPEFVEIYKKIEELGFEDEPDYDGIIGLIEKAIADQSMFNLNAKYDWELFSNEQLKKISAIPLAMGNGNNGKNQEDQADKKKAPPPEKELHYGNRTVC